VSGSAALANHIVGRLLARGNRYAFARAAFVRSLIAARKEDDQVLATRACANLGVCCYRLGELSESLHFNRTALRDARRLKMPKLEAESLGNIGNVHFTANRLKLAGLCQKECLRLARNRHYDLLEANTLGNLGIISQKAKDYLGARQYYAQARRVASRIGDAVGQSRHMYNLAHSYELERKASLAMKWLSLAEQESRAVGQDETVARCVLGRGRLLGHAGRMDEAEASLLQSLRLFERTNTRLNIADCHEALGDFYVKRGHPNEARKYFMRARSVSEHLRDAEAKKRLTEKLGSLR